MYKIHTLQNGLTLITINLPHLESVTTLIAVGAGSRYETRATNGISHFLEHMFFKGSKKYPSAEQIASIVDGIGAVNNAATDKEITYYWIKSAAKHVELASDILSSQLKESLFDQREIEKEKGVIVEEIRMYLDMPSRYVWDLYEELQFGDQPLGWQIAGDEKTVKTFKRQDFLDYMKQFYRADNMALVYVGNLPDDIESLGEKYFGGLPKGAQASFLPYHRLSQDEPRVHIFNKATDQVNLVLGVEGYDRIDDRRFAARLLGTILGEGMSSRLFMEVREKRGLAYHVSASHSSYHDAGVLTAFAGIKVEKLIEGIGVIREELEKTTKKAVSKAELEKAKEMERGRLALRSESTNFLAEHFGTKFVLDRELETFEDYLKKIDKVTTDDIQQVAIDLFKPQKYNLEMIGPIGDPEKFKELLK
ncbi:hypothetical protein A2631_06070 [Candidatus Daviesbacteria bacterium RIFCSPHIGHO2_01_FULL_44_29]|uniref:Peptidase M16 n=1 Tax=Candidatus Daviesbacteria bacterium RIFCSPHIGHO2_02_FULL_43_12 TaxID=1797776 RepID=A0A1F5KJ85_9BACT|nr:MAG: hypothetical protein A2631_06070 [Candidatus Daviesbacteria bacterium RIFCSPHIGHO2_01_FULL_44_29]OGE40962.1 MAG: hypothetical protein A3D25_02900 [Candidatus Daviesbacteria bacterium RIFCSPHIGHO2_02_FULL_43_12]OGE69887.1 MAG: hypothetical protein A3B55_05770 [Candidatus Daviesbacteria bacterium RIFCSPLOWO2_01_FULL_43_15]